MLFSLSELISEKLKLVKDDFNFPINTNSALELRQGVPMFTKGAENLDKGIAIYGVTAWGHANITSDYKPQI